ncbi:MAG: glutamine synthetase family protein [Paracoccaceae bacterium]
MPKSLDKALEWIKDTGNCPKIIAATCDLNGIWRGKRIPVTEVEKVLKSGIRLPISASCVDVWGTDLAKSPFLFKSGDSDGDALSTGLGLIPDYPNYRDSAFLPLWIFDNQKKPSPIDPRHILNSICNQFNKLNLNPVVAFEIEFYLLDINKGHNEVISANNVLSVTDLETNTNFFDDLYRACAEFNIPMEGISSENAPGQFEINLKHVADPLMAADHAVLFKRFIKGIAKKHDKTATFMAKPLPGMSGSGMHVHMSLIDKLGNNVFSNKNDLGSEILKNAVAGILENLSGSTLIFAPHFNSYKRLRPGTHAPINICWGYENRTAAVRIPGGNDANKRIEHRVAGADSNPYLVMSSILASVLDGIKHKKTPPAPIFGDTYSEKLMQIPQSWDQAIQSFENSEINRKYYPKIFNQVFGNCKKQELETFNARIEEHEITTYLEGI